MTNPSNLTPSEQPPSPPRRPALFLKVGAGLGVVIALGAVAGAVWGKRIINSQVLPLVEERVADIIDRPIDLGDVERLSFSGIQLGKTTIPSTQTDRSSVTVDQVSVGFDVRSLLFDKTLKPHIALVRPDLSLVQNKDGQWLELSLPEPLEEEPLVTTNIQSIKIQDAQVTATPFIQDANAIVPREPLEINQADVTATFEGEESQQVYFELAGDVEAGSFDIQGEGNLDNQAVKANLRTQNLPTTGVNILLPSLVGLSSGTLNTNLTVAAALAADGSLDQSSVDVQGTAQFRDVQVLVRDLPEPVRDIRSQLRFKGQQVTLEKTELQLGEVALLAAGTVDWEEGYDLTAQIPEVRLADVQTLATLELPEDLPVDKTVPFELNTQVTGKLADPNVKGRLANLEPLLVDKVRLATVAADFVLPLPEFELTAFELTELRLVPEAGGVVLAQGQADFAELKTPSFKLTGQANVPVDPFTQLYGAALPPEMTIGSLTAELAAEGTLENQTAFAQWQLSESTFPGQGDLTLVDNVLVAENTILQVFGGTVTANATAQLEGGAWQATVATDQIPVEQFTPQAQGLLSAELDAGGNLYAFDLAKIEAGGRAAIANAQVLIPNTRQPLLEQGDWTTTFQWQGDQVAIESFNAPGIQADGTIGVDFNQPIPIGALNLNVALQQFDLQPLNNIAPATVQNYGQLAGLTSFNGQITGTLDNPLLAGDARLDQLALNNLVFQTLTGPVTFSLADGGSLDLNGPQDRLQLSLDNRFWPVSFEVRNQEFVARGYGQDNQLHADIVQLPLDTLNVRPVNGFGKVAGLLNASIDADLTDFANPTARGELTIVQPALAPVEAQQVTATFRYGNNTATLEQGELLLDNSRYLLTGSATLAPQIQYTGELTVAEGRIEDLVALVEDIDLSAFSLGDLSTPQGTAADLAVEPAALPAGSLLEQLEAFVAFMETQPSVDDDGGQLVIPPLADLTGGFTGTIAVAGDSPAINDVKANFDLQGDSWQWGPYAPPNEFLIRGDVQALSVNFEPVLITAGETIISLSGSGDLDQLTGQLTVDNLPVELADYIYPLPVAAAGELDLVTQFDGSLANPVVEGRAIVINPQVNNYSLNQVETTFSYRNAILDVAGDMAIEPEDAPITLRGTVPYALPFMTVQPATERLALKAVVPDDSFDVINTLTQDQVRWEEGRGEVVVQVDGTVQQPIVTGNMSLRDGVVSSALLKTPVTNLSGDIQFDLEQIGIQNLQANLGDGLLQVAGQLPLFPPGQSILAQAAQTTKTAKKQSNRRSKNAADGLLISLDQLPIDYSGILQAVFDGQVSITGAVLEPTVGGTIEIGNGQIRATELLSQAGAITVPTEADLEEVNPYRADFLGVDPLAPKSAAQPTSVLDKVTLQDFALVLSDRLSIVGQPFFNIRALGDLTINGTFSALKPRGVIALKSGWINLFSTQFRLDSNASNTATFTPENGLDPYVDVVMTTRVQETNVSRVPASSGEIASAEIDDNTTLESVGDVQYINVQAVAQGNASELSDSLALTSNPSRNQDMLLALLGSNVIQGLASGSLTQFAGFLGAGSLARFSNDLANALGLQSFSVFPTTDTSTESTAGIGIGVEASFRLGNSINISILEILNSGNPPQLGLQYRLSDELQLEGSSDLNDTELKLEYRIEF
ncbi:translocation/assembly module TamB domain-containing protein [Leptolyngbya cf. ectocarpi LEGE 11479]|uniref:Translocation/assembly module TamB domain-containing protein n=1 Tax=Leptolyngbya cf. ectocarpi LEGE 11479 TaxID=1828722 RepID=A0A929FCD0_LEPEC|nr:translocation/assembly module TamB domain-containing protein [Leptolyngbya ectocarpi]MBE9069458.1 translocation/assembly module TamB domain-containing protein [Leptolyngbya cf. ectocarpi LEGE 11479]